MLTGILCGSIARAPGCEGGIVYCVSQSGLARERWGRVARKRSDTISTHVDETSNRLAQICSIPGNPDLLITENSTLASGVA